MTAADTTTARRVPGAGLVTSILITLVWPVWAITLAAWAIQLGGLSAVQYSAGEHYLQFDWFVTSLHFIVQLFMLFYLCMRRSTPGMTSLISVVTGLEVTRTNVWNNARLSRNLTGQSYVQVDSLINPGLNTDARTINALLAGYLITAAFDFLLLITVSGLPAYSGQDNEHLLGKQHSATSREEYI